MQHGREKKKDVLFLSKLAQAERRAMSQRGGSTTNMPDLWGVVQQSVDLSSSTPAGLDVKVERIKGLERPERPERNRQR